LQAAGAGDGLYFLVASLGIDKQVAAPAHVAQLGLCEILPIEN
jgi:hypothetical protein